jgi:hypothetical protein
MFFDGTTDFVVGSVVGGVAKFGGATFNSGATATKPATPSKGDIFFDTTLNRLEVYDGGAWKHTTEFAEDIKVHGITVGKGSGAGVENTAIGLNALNANTTGDGNTAYGSNASLKNTSGSDNVAIGKSALKENTTGQKNVAIGSETANTGNISEIVAVGYGALKSSTNGQNVAVGKDAGSATTSGTLNTFIGHGSGSSNTTGSKNVIIGGFTGNNAGLDIRTKNNHIVLSDGDGNPRAYCDANGVWSNGVGGSSQSWQNVSGSRALTTTYTNSTNKPIFVVVQCIVSGGSTAELHVDTIAFSGSTGSGAGSSTAVFAVVPAGSTYRAQVNGAAATSVNWAELR